MDLLNNDITQFCELVSSISINVSNLKRLPVDQYGEGESFDQVSFEANSEYLYTQQRQLRRLIKRISKTDITYK